MQILKTFIKQNKVKFYYLFFILLFFQDVTSQESSVFRVVLDAGHGGEDPGAVNINLKLNEKDIALDVCLRTEAILSKLEGIEVYLTRRTDVFIPVFQRAEIANKKKANLFLSVHLNAITSPVPVGTETFVMGLSKSRSNLEVAKKENAVITLEKDYKTKYAGYNPNSPETLIGLTLLQEQYLDQSINLARKLQYQYTNNLKRYNRGVKQDVFLVLHKAAMPSVLTELGFISNDEEAQYMNSVIGKEKLAQAIANAIIEYKNDFFQNNFLEIPKNNDKNLDASDILGIDDPTLKKGKEEEKIEVEEKKVDIKKEKDSNTKPTIIEPKIIEPEIIKNTISNTNENQIIFKVQIKSANLKLNLNDKFFKGISNITEFKEKNLFKYYYFESTSFKEVNKKLIEARNKGFKDAFIVGFKNQVRIDINKYKK